MNGTGAKISSMSGAGASGAVRTKASASPTFELSMPLPRATQLASWRGDCAATSDEVTPAADRLIAIAREVVLQVGADAGAVDHAVDVTLAEVVGRTDA